MSTEEKIIKIKKEDSQLTQLRKNLDGAKNDFLKLQSSGTASAKALKDAGDKVTQYGTALNKARKETNDLANATKKISGEHLLNFGKNLTVVGAGIYAATQGMIGFGKALLNATQEGADFTILLESFKRIGGTDADLKLMRIASSGNLTKEELIKLSLANKQLGFTLSQTTSLLDKIEVQADLTGKAFGDANESIKKFIASGSSRGLVGFLEIPKLKEEVDKLNKSWTDSGKELTDVQEEANRTRAIFNLLEGSSGDLSLKQMDVADATASISTTMQDLKKDSEEALLKGISPFIEKLANSPKDMQQFITGVENIGKAIGWTFERFSNIINAVNQFIFLLNNPSLRNFMDWVSLKPGQQLGWGEGQGSIGNYYNYGGRPLITQNPAIGAIQRGDNKAGEAQANIIKNKADQTLDDTNAIYSSISSVMNLLDIKSHTFVGTLIGGFQTVLTIMEAIKTVNSILSIIPGFAEGGVATGLFMAGERGAELINVGNNSARVYKNSDTMRMLNNFNMNSSPVIYISSNINPAYIDMRIDKKRAGEKYIRR